jgi:hypothetical protein
MPQTDVPDEFANECAKSIRFMGWAHRSTGAAARAGRGYWTFRATANSCAPRVDEFS